MIRVEDLRLTIALYSLLESLNTELGLHRDRQPPSQDAPDEPVDDAGDANEGSGSRHLVDAATAYPERFRQAILAAHRRKHHSTELFRFPKPASLCRCFRSQPNPTDLRLGNIAVFQGDPRTCGDDRRSATVARPCAGQHRAHRPTGSPFGLREKLITARSAKASLITITIS